MDPKKFFAELTRRNVYKIAKSCFLLGWWSRSPGSHDAVINVYDVAGKLIEVHRHKGDFKDGGVGARSWCWRNHRHFVMVDRIC
jgi:peroxiredoxin